MKDFSWMRSPDNWTYFLSGAVALLVFFVIPVPQGLAERERYATDRVLFRLKDDVGEAFPDGSSPMGGGDLVERLGMPDGVRIISGGGDRGGGGISAMGVEENAFAAPYHVLWLNGLMTVEDCLVRLGGHPLIEYVEVDGIGEGGNIPPNDPSYAQQWHHAKIQSPEVWRTTRGSEEVVVAVLDTGVNGSLAEFQGRMVPGYNFVSDSPLANDDHGHGTAVAGVIAANANNGHLVTGVDWNCRIMPVKVLDRNNTGYYSWWADAIYFAVANGARVINLSAGGDTDNNTLKNAVRHAVREGVVFVSITHNDGTGVVRFPGRMPESITVGATERDDRWASFSNWGTGIDLVAPGRDIYTVSRTGTLTWWWGTSFAAPQVSAVAALLLSVRPDLDQEGVRLLLRAGADDQVGDWRDVPGFDFYHGAGRLNAFHSLTLATVAISEVERLPDEAVRLRWPAPANAALKRPFAVEYSEDLRGWRPVGTGPVYSGTAGLGEWIDGGGAGRAHPASVSRRFYRVIVRE